MIFSPGFFVKRAFVFFHRKKGVFPPPEYLSEHIERVLKVIVLKCSLDER